MTLKEARERHSEARKVLASGIDPMAERKAVGVECPAFFEPVEVRQTGTRGVIYGTREEAYGRADREPAAAG